MKNTMGARRRGALRALLAAALMGGTGAWAADASYPAGNVTLVIAYSAGGISDAVGREVAHGLEKVWGKTVIVDNRPGANGNIGARFAAQQPGDGYTLFQAMAGTHAANVSLYPKLDYDPVADFTPIGLVAESPLVLTINANLPVKNVAELVAYAKAHPDATNFGSAGSGAPSHLALELFNRSADIHIGHIPYKGATQLLPDLLSNRIQGYFDAVASALPNVTAGKLRAVGVTSAVRSASFPNVPTMKEAGYPGFVLTTWFGIVASGRLPPRLRDQLSADLTKVVSSPEYLKWCTDQGLRPLKTTPDEFAKFMADETKKLGALIREAKITLE